MADVIAAECAVCGAVVWLNSERGGRQIAAGALDGWDFDVDAPAGTRWTCPEHRSATGGSGAP